MYGGLTTTIFSGEQEVGVLTGGAALAIASSESDVRFLSAMIIGPPDTPYEFGFFEVSE